MVVPTPNPSSVSTFFHQSLHGFPPTSQFCLMAVTIFFFLFLLLSPFPQGWSRVTTSFCLCHRAPLSDLSYFSSNRPIGKLYTKGSCHLFHVRLMCHLAFRINFPVSEEKLILNEISCIWYKEGFKVHQLFVLFPRPDWGIGNVFYNHPLQEICLRFSKLYFQEKINKYHLTV